jgi:hypothetical protein
MLDNNYNSNHENNEKFNYNIIKFHLSNINLNTIPNEYPHAPHFC